MEKSLKSSKKRSNNKSKALFTTKKENYSQYDSNMNLNEEIIDQNSEYNINNYDSEKDNDELNESMRKSTKWTDVTVNLFSFLFLLQFFLFKFL